jgi:hypothetical protein
MCIGSGVAFDKWVFAVIDEGFKVWDDWLHGKLTQRQWAKANEHLIRQTDEAARWVAFACGAEQTLTATIAGLLTPSATDLGARPRTFSWGNLPPGELGSTDIYGNITIQEGLTGEAFEQTLRHETVHSVLTPPVPFNYYTTQFYGSSALWRYTEEALAEGYATRSVIKGLVFPLAEDYVKVDKVLNELGVLTRGTAIVAGTGYVGYRVLR